MPGPRQPCTSTSMIVIVTMYSISIRIIATFCKWSGKACRAAVGGGCLQSSGTKLMDV